MGRYVGEDNPGYGHRVVQMKEPLSPILKEDLGSGSFFICQLYR